MEQVDERTPLRVKPDERVPPPGHRKAVRVPNEQWEAHGRPRDTARGHLDEDAPTE